MQDSAEFLKPTPDTQGVGLIPDPNILDTKFFRFLKSTLCKLDPKP